MIDTTSGPRQLAASWYLLMIRGVLTVLFGVLAFVFPLTAARTFVLLFGVYVFAYGLTALITAVRWHAPDTARWWYVIAQAVTGLAIGLTTFIEPSVTGYALGILIAVWALLTGFLEIATGRRIRAHVPGEIFLVLAGIASIALGIVFLMEPRLPLIVLTLAIAAYAVVGGLSLIIIASRLRGIHMTGTGLRR